MQALIPAQRQAAAGAQTVCIDADNAVSLGIVVGRAAIDLDAKDGLLQKRTVATKFCFNDEAQQGRQPGGTSKGLRLFQSPEFLENLFLRILGMESHAKTRPVPGVTESRVTPDLMNNTVGLS